MGSIYFLAGSDAQAVGFVGRVEDLLAGDHVLAHDLITVPHLTALPDLADGAPVAVDLSVLTQLWPVMPQDPQADVSWMAEPVIERLADPLRDRIAAIQLERVPGLLEAWTEQVSGSVDEQSAGQLAADLIDLARRGRDRGLALYNWYEL